MSEALIARELREWAAAEDLTGSMDDCYIAKLRRAADALAARPEGEPTDQEKLDGDWADCQECGKVYPRDAVPLVCTNSDCGSVDFHTCGFVPAPTVTPEMVERYEKALREITQRMGRFNRDPLKHAENTIDDMAAIATTALRAALPERGK